VEPLGKLDLNLLRSLDVLLTTANVSKAATKLKISQSTLSAQLARLRGYFNDDLLVPSESGRGLALTPRSTELHGQIRDLIAQIQRVMLGSNADARPIASASTRFNIVVAASDGASLSLVAKCVVQGVHLFSVQ